MFSLIHEINTYCIKKKLEDTNGLIRNRSSQDGQYNDKTKKQKNQGSTKYYICALKTKDMTTRNRDELG